MKTAIENFGMIEMSDDLISVNFEFLKEDCPSIYEHAFKMENNIFSDPTSSVGHGNWILNFVINFIYLKENIVPSLNVHTIYEKINDLTFTHEVIPKNINKYFNQARIQRNEIIHDGISKTGMLYLNKNIFLILVWIYKSYYNPDFEPNHFIDPVDRFIESISSKNGFKYPKEPDLIFKDEVKESPKIESDEVIVKNQSKKDYGGSKQLIIEKTSKDYAVGMSNVKDSKDNLSSPEEELSNELEENFNQDFVEFDGILKEDLRRKESEISEIQNLEEFAFEDNICFRNDVFVVFKGSRVFGSYKSIIVAQFIKSKLAEANWDVNKFINHNVFESSSGLFYGLVCNKDSLTFLGRFQSADEAEERVSDFKLENEII